MNKKLEIENLHVRVEGKMILKGIDLKIRTGEKHAIMGPNGSGKSTLANVLMGHPKYEIVKGDIKIDGESIKDLTPEERAKRGIFLAFQYPIAIPGVKIFDFLRTAVNNIRRGRGMKPIPYMEFMKKLRETFEILGLDSKFMYRYINEGFSGGEKKRLEIVQMILLEPHFAVLDETDSGLDIDSIKIVANAIDNTADKMGTLIITHYRRILEYVKPTHVHVLINGRIVKSGGIELANELEKTGYEILAKSVGV